MIPISVRVDTSGAEIVMKRYGENLSRSKQEQLLEMGRFGYRSAKMRAPKATGALAAEIYVDTSLISKGVINIVSPTPYAKYQEFGYTPHFAPAGAMHVKGGVGLDVPPLYYFVQKYTPYMGPAMAAMANKLDSFMYKIVNNAAARTHSNK